MLKLKRLVGRKFLLDHLHKAQACFGQGLSLAVVDQEGQILCAAGDEKNMDFLESQEIIKSPISLEEQIIGHLLIRLPNECTESLRKNVASKAEFIIMGLQAIVESELARRAVTAETLEMYRSHAHLNRAVLGLNHSMVVKEIGESLLAEFCGHESIAEWGVVFWPDQKTGHQRLVGVSGRSPDDLFFSQVVESELFHSITAHAHGEIINHLTSDPRWQVKQSEDCALLMVPLENPGKVAGMLVLGISSSQQEFRAVDLHRASTLSVVAATALRNAILFEETLSIKNYNENILKSLSNGVITFDLEGTIVKVNQAALRILGIDADQLPGHSAQILFRETNAWVGDRIDRLLEMGKVEDVTEKNLITKSGKIISINLSTVPMLGLDGRLIGGLLVFDDISREKRVKNALSRYMPSQVIDDFLGTNDVSVLGGIEQEVTILFSDLRSFTSLSEDLSALETIAMLNDYLGRMVDLIFSNDGTLDKFIGDAIMAVFGTPLPTGNDAENAVLASQDMMIRLREFNASRARKGNRPLRIGIGINTGLVVSGYIGSPKRMDYTVIGDEVNLTARIESATKYYGTPILLSENTFTRIKKPLRSREIDRVRVKGKHRPVRIFEILDYVTEQEFPAVDKALEYFNSGMAAYNQRQWQQASEAFAQVIRIKSTDKPSVIYLQRCLGWMEKDPGQEWDGVTTLA
ncbi:MAG: PAS domain S-box protein [Magnetococcus sp. DMHC-1]|nr:PAS domain S-box protein [Magnetococcales bacterium]